MGIKPISVEHCASDGSR